VLQESTRSLESFGGDRDSVSIVFFRREEPGNGAARSINRRDKKALGRTLMRTALARETGFDSEHWTLANRPSGEPVIESAPPDAATAKVSLSHSGLFFAAAASSCNALGVDIEIVRKRRFREIAEYLNWPTPIWNSGAHLDPNRFYQLWTLWEATLKANSGNDAIDTTQLFNDLANEIEPGRPSSASLGDWRIQSWKREGEFWVTVVLRLDTMPQIRLFEMTSRALDTHEPDIRAIVSSSDFFSTPSYSAGTAQYDHVR
jgi:phosphopantetheinyl transferase